MLVELLPQWRALNFMVPNEDVISLLVTKSALFVIRADPVVGTNNFRMAEKPFEYNRILRLQRWLGQCLDNFFFNLDPAPLQRLSFMRLKLLLKIKNFCKLSLIYF